jgi:hypothetical protein
MAASTEFLANLLKTRLNDVRYFRIESGFIMYVRSSDQVQYNEADDRISITAFDQGSKKWATEHVNSADIIGVCIEEEVNTWFPDLTPP